MSDFNPNARGHRASICVRACTGIPDKVLEDPEYSVKEELDSLDQIITTSAQILQQRDTAWAELREIREAIKADENESTADEVRSLVNQRDDLRTRLTALEEIATAVEADIDCGRPLEYNVEHLRDELIRARKALGILPEQEQTNTLGLESPEAEVRYVTHEMALDAGDPSLEGTEY